MMNSAIVSAQLTELKDAVNMLIYGSIEYEYFKIWFLKWRKENGFS